MNRREFVLLPLAAYATASIAAGPITDVQLQRSSRVKSISVLGTGAVGDGKANDSAAIQAAIDEAKRLGGADVVLPKGFYLASGLRMYSNVRLLGDGRDKTILRETTGSDYLLSINPGGAGSPDPSQNQHDVEIAGIAFEGPVASLGFSEHRHLLNFNGVTELWIHDCTIRGFRGDGLYLGSSNVFGVERHNISVRISQNEFDGINCDNRNGISVIDGTRIRIENNYFTRCSRRDMPGPIDIEPDGNFFLRIEDILIEGNRFDDCGGGVGKISVVIPVPPNLKYAVRKLKINKNIITSGQRTGNGIYVHILPFDGTYDPKSGAFASSVLIANNQIEHGFSYIRGIRDFNIAGNLFIGGNTPLILGATEMNQEAYAIEGSVADNRFEGQIGKNGALTVGRAKLVAIRDNRFSPAKSATSDPPIAFVSGNNEPLCHRVTLSNNRFSDGYQTHAVSHAPATSDRIALLESNRTFSGKQIITSGFLKP
jgi:hypothetical protein